MLMQIKSYRLEAKNNCIYSASVKENLIYI